MGFHQISDRANITQASSCPVQILKCTVYYDDQTDLPFLELELKNNSGKSVAVLGFSVVCYNRAGAAINRQDQSYYLQENRCETSDTTPGRLYALRHEIERVSVKVERVLVYQNGESGEMSSIM